MLVDELTYCLNALQARSQVSHVLVQLSHTGAERQQVGKHDQNQSQKNMLKNYWSLLKL